MTTERMANRLVQIYPALSTSERNELVNRLERILEDAAEEIADQRGPRWSERDLVLITYADQVRANGRPTLETLRKFLEKHNVDQAINIVHLLPFFPFSSDDGFSVIDYCRPAENVGDWSDVDRLANRFDLMFDLVLNHCSVQHQWFQGFLDGDPRYQDFFHVVSPETDLSQVVRPRSLPLLTRFETVFGPRWVWTTFSEDQVDLNFGNPEVLLEFVRILLFYVKQGARIIRLDAVAFLWKEPGTRCIHLRNTHLIVKLFRDILEQVAPHVLLLTETNVPHAENVSYFGEGDEAHMVYQFSLPPLVVDTFVHEDAEPLRNWLLRLKPIPAGTTFFNFGASHDGIGVRPLEGLLSDERFDSLIRAIRERGGLISTRRTPDGNDVPYELNISYFDAISGNENDPETAIRKFLASQAIILSLPGIPGIYFHSLVGTPNDLDGAIQTGINRRINRRKYQLSELEQLLSNDSPDPSAPENDGVNGSSQSSIQSDLFRRFLSMLQIRTRHAAFHPDSDCEIWQSDRCGRVLGSDSVLAISRRSSAGEEILILVNPRRSPVELDVSSFDCRIDICHPERNLAASVPLDGFGFLLLKIS